MFQSLLTILTLVVAIAGGLLVVLYILGGSLYDLKLAKQRRKLEKTKSKRSVLVSVIVDVNKEADNLEACLRSLLKGDYPKLEIIVDHHGSIETKRIVSQMRKADKRIVSTRANVSKPAGKFVMRLSADKKMDRQAIAKAVSLFKINPNLQVLVPNQQTSFSYSWLNIAHQYKDLLQNRFRKLTSTLDATRLLPECFMATSSTYKEIASSSTCRYFYASDVLVYSSTHETSREYLLGAYKANLFEWRALPARFKSSLNGTLSGLGFICLNTLALLTPLAITYFCYMAIVLHEPTMLIAYLGVLSLVILSAVLSEDNLKFRQRLAYVLGLPLAFIGFYVSLIGRIILSLSMIIET